MTEKPTVRRVGLASLDVERDWTVPKVSTILYELAACLSPPLKSAALSPFTEPPPSGRRSVRTNTAHYSPKRVYSTVSVHKATALPLVGGGARCP